MKDQFDISRVFETTEFEIAQVACSSIPLLSKFPASSHLLCFFSSVCVRPVRKPHCSCWLSHDAAHIFYGGLVELYYPCSENKASVLVQLGLCRTSSKIPKTGFLASRLILYLVFPAYLSSSVVVSVVRVTAVWPDCSP